MKNIIIILIIFINIILLGCANNPSNIERKPNCTDLPSCPYEEITYYIPTTTTTTKS